MPTVTVTFGMRQSASGVSLPETRVNVCGRDLVFLGRPGPLLEDAVRAVQQDAARAAALAQLAPGDVRD